MRCNLTKLVRCMMLVVLTVLCINVFVVLKSRPGSSVLAHDEIPRAQPHHSDGHESRTSTTPKPPPPLNSSVTCPGLTMMEPRPAGEFQTVLKMSVYVYSAYLAENTLTIIGLQEQIPPEVTITCQVWYRLKGREPLILTTVSVNQLPEDHGRRFAAVFYLCQLPENMRNETPYAVSLVIGEQCTQPTTILVVGTQGKMSSEFTVCVTPLNYRYSRAYELVEMIEMNKLLGAQKIVFYNQSTGPNVNQVLEAYASSGDVDVHQWHLPMRVDTWPPIHIPEIHYFAQIASLNDCLYRYRGRSKYLVYQDLDEFIIPYKHDNWTELVRDREGKITSLAAIQFKCVFYRKEWPKPAPNFEDVAKKYKSVILTNTIRENNYLLHGTRSKYFVNPLKATSVGVHNVWYVTGAMDTISEEVAALHHYRSWEKEFDIVDRLEDPSAALKYGSRLADRLGAAWSRLKNVSMDIDITTYGDHV